ncbi:MAG: hypothetical protein ACREVY_15780 [Gammaproteobacteria bacterium]
MTRGNDDIDWSLTSWEGSRRAQLRRWLALTVRERLQAIEEMAEVAARIAGSPRLSERHAAKDTPASVAGGGSGVPADNRGSS